MLQLTIEKTNQNVVGEVLCMCILEYEKKYDDGAHDPEEIIFNIMIAISETRKQIKAASDYRVEVLNNIRHSPNQPGTIHGGIRKRWGGHRCNSPYPGPRPRVHPDLERSEQFHAQPQKKAALLVAGPDGSYAGRQECGFCNNHQ